MTDEDNMRFEQCHDSMSLRAALALELDGADLSGGGSTDDSYRVAGRLQGSLFAALRDRLHRLGDGAVVAVGNHFDPMQRMLMALGISHDTVDAPAKLPDETRVAFLGCVAGPNPFDTERATELLATGALLVTSDKSAQMPVLAPVLRPGAPQAPRQISLDVNRSMWSDADDTAACATLNGFVPKVRLAPGSLAIDPAFERDVGAWVLASDAATTAPLAVLLAVGGGQVVHSVAHWWQDDVVPANALDSMLVADMPGFRSGIIDDSTATFGRLCRAWGMLQVLTAGLTLALQRGDAAESRTEVLR